MPSLTDDSEDHDGTHFGLPSVGCYLAVPPAVWFAGDLVTRQTSVGWRFGPQPVGFALFHSLLGPLLLFALLVGLLWGVYTLGAAVHSKRRRNLTNISGAFTVIASAALVSVRYERWTRLFASKIAHGPHATAFLVFWAAHGDISTVGALLEQGILGSDAGIRCTRAISAAENANQPGMRAYLIERCNMISRS